MTKILGIAVVFMGMSSALLAGAVPEIDANTGSSALALILGGILVVRGRFKK